MAQYDFITNETPTLNQIREFGWILCIRDLYRKHNSLTKNVDVLTTMEEGQSTDGLLSPESILLITNYGLKLKNLGTYTHIYHVDNTSGHTQTWYADADNVYLQYFCTAPKTGNITEHNHSHNQAPMPVASATLAGIITADSGAFFDENTTGKVDTLNTLKSFLDGVENTTELYSIETTDIKGIYGNNYVTSNFAYFLSEEIPFEPNKTYTIKVKGISYVNANDATVTLSLERTYTVTVDASGTTNTPITANGTVFRTALENVPGAPYDGKIAGYFYEKSGSNYAPWTHIQIQTGGYIKIVGTASRITPLQTRLPSISIDPHAILISTLTRASLDVDTDDHKFSQIHVYLPFKLSDLNITDDSPELKSLLNGCYVQDFEHANTLPTVTVNGQSFAQPGKIEYFEGIGWFISCNHGLFELSLTFNSIDEPVALLNMTIVRFNGN